MTTYMKKILKIISLMSLALSLGLVGFGSSLVEAANYTKVDVATHNLPTDCWIIVNNNVYNLTSFINSHAGNENIIINHCGQNGTNSLKNWPVEVNNVSKINSYLLGPLVTTSPVLTSLTIEPVMPTVTIGGTVQLVVIPKDQDKLPFAGATVTYSSNDPTIATINSAGLITGIATGKATITITSVGGNITISKEKVILVTTETLPNPNLHKNDKEDQGKHLGFWHKWFNHFEKMFKHQKGLDHNGKDNHNSQ